jgi:hypothetical protein
VPGLRDIPVVFIQPQPRHRLTTARALAACCERPKGSAAAQWTRKRDEFHIKPVAVANEAPPVVVPESVPDWCDLT